MVQPNGAGAASQTRAGQDAVEQSTDVPAYLAALRRGAWLMALIVVPLTATVLVLSLVLPKTYSATSSLVLEEPTGVLEAPSAETSTRRLATIRRLLISQRACSSARPQTCPASPATRWRTRSRPPSTIVADIIEVRALDGDAEGAAAIANGVTRTFLAGAGRSRAPAGRDRAAGARAGAEAARGARRVAVRDPGAARAGSTS